ncbi:penicillin-binding protein [Dinghuibacter silviterrae]|uniref:Cell division protein FtsI (Penicillin-binding protein 3) n=1 Tax=Dinghuibacter silviterrae TaxID=1539049 RepID=A0A4V3GLN5_9BACT|nr:penicillin-binding protein [Dinghuibacter silviterrae]TDX00243.1 cell division protein FtsI (penicillin-binding protein 3) [Dinghuibacter silviterrae]
MEVKRDILWRVYLSYLGIVVLALVILGRAFYIQHIEGAHWRSMADSLHQRYVEIEAERGTIYDDEGNMLSTSIPYFDVYIDFGADGLREKNGLRFRESIDSLSGCLARLFADEKPGAYKRALEQGYNAKNRYYLLKRNITFEQYRTLHTFPLVRLGRNKSGFIEEVHEKRLTPYGLLANRTIGLARENVHNVGLEATYDSSLRGETGKRLVRYIAGGTMVPVEGAEIDAENGKDIVTTIDVTIQDIAENALLKMLAQNEAVHGTCIVMETATGKIKAMANLGLQKDGTYWEDYNYAVSTTEPGSTFKLVTLMSLLEDHKVSLQDYVNIQGGEWTVNGRTVHDAERDDKPEVTVKEAFEASSNVGMAKLAYGAYENNPYQFVNHVRALRMDSVTGIDLSGEGRPVVKTPKNRSWSATTLPWMAFGYEELVSPLQTLTLYNAVANNGTMLKPYLVQEIREYGHTVRTFEPVVLRPKICSDATLRLLKSCLEGVVIEGTAKSLNTPVYPIAGKTGTALVANGTEGYKDHIYQSSFVGYFPADRPAYTCIVVIRNKPHAAVYLGAKVAGPVFREVSDQLYALYTKGNDRNLVMDSSMVSFSGNASVWSGLGVKVPDTGWVTGVTGPAQGFRWSFEKTPDAQGIPSVQGMGLKDALYLLENKGLKVSVRGRGKVLAQSLPAGTQIKRGETIYLQLG